MKAALLLALFLALPAVLAAYLVDETVSGYADGEVYRLIELDGAPFTARATLDVSTPGQVSGEGPCTRFSAAQSVPYPWIEIGPIRATKRACPQLAEEAVYFTALSEMSLAEALGNILILTNDKGRELVFQIMP